MALINKISARVKNGTFVRRSLEKLFGHSAKHSKATIPAGDTYYGSRADDYLAVRKQQDYWHLEQEVVEKILADFPRDIRVLDVPFGTGRFVPYYLKNNMEVHGLDASGDMVAVARRELGEDYDKCTVEIGDAAKLPYEDRSFDLVLSFRFLSHVVPTPQARVILRELRRVCQKDLIIQLRVRRDDAPPVKPPTDDETFGDRLTLNQVEEEFATAGFQIERTWQLEERETYYRAVFLCNVA